MTIPNYSESDTRSKLIDPALRQRGWTEDHIRREENAGESVKVGGRWKREQKKVDYVLRVPVVGGAEPVAVGLIEAKKNTLPPGHGLEQAKQYGEAKRLNVPFVFTSNGSQYVEYDSTTGLTSPPRPMDQFPTPAELRQRYEAFKGFGLETPAAQPLLTRYTGGDSVRRYYQDAAIRAVLERIAAGGNRALLALATGAGKTRIAVHLLKRIADAGQLRRVLFVCDRTELRDQAHAAFHNVFGNDAQKVEKGNPKKNARILIATYQTLDVDTDTDTGSFFTDNYPANYFSHIIIDEAHRSAWGKWSIVLTRNPDAVQIGLTATPRQLKVKEEALASPEAQADLQVTADNLRYFGEPVYEYDMAQGIKDGYLAAVEVQRSTVNLDNTGITRTQIMALQPRDHVTGRLLTEKEVADLYERTSFEGRILLPDRQHAMSEDLFRHLLATGGPEQKTIIFCASDTHAQQIANLMNNLYARWCQQQGRALKEHYAFKCTAASSGNDMLPDFKESGSSYFIATTVELLTTGVDVPRARNIVFFRYLKSPISFYQMVGRGTRLYLQDNKLSFRVYDYTGATDLFGEDFITEPRREAGDDRGGDDGGGDLPPDKPDWVESARVEVAGFDVVVADQGKFIVTQVDGREKLITVEEYKQEVAARLVAQAPDLGSFRDQWVQPDARRALLWGLPSQGQSAELIRALDELSDCDLFDVLGGLGYGLAPRTLQERADAFAYKQAGWLRGLPPAAAATIRAIAGQFAQGGTDELESGQIWQTPAVRQAGGVQALTLAGDPAHLLKETKVRMFAA